MSQRITSLIKPLLAAVIASSISVQSVLAYDLNIECNGGNLGSFAVAKQMDIFPRLASAMKNYNFPSYYYFELVLSQEGKVIKFEPLNKKLNPSIRKSLVKKIQALEFKKFEGLNSCTFTLTFSYGEVISPPEAPHRLSIGSPGTFEFGPPKVKSKSESLPESPLIIGEKKTDIIEKESVPYSDEDRRFDKKLVEVFNQMKHLRPNSAQLKRQGPYALSPYDWSIHQDPPRADLLEEAIALGAKLARDKDVSVNSPNMVQIKAIYPKLKDFEKEALAYILQENADSCRSIEIRKEILSVAYQISQSLPERNPDLENAMRKSAQKPQEVLTKLDDTKNVDEIVTLWNKFVSSSASNEQETLWAELDKRVYELQFVPRFAIKAHARLNMALDSMDSKLREFAQDKALELQQERLARLVFVLRMKNTGVFSNQGFERLLRILIPHKKFDQGTQLCLESLDYLKNSINGRIYESVSAVLVEYSKLLKKLGQTESATKIDNEIEAEKLDNLNRKIAVLKEQIERQEKRGDFLVLGRRFHGYSNLTLKRAQLLSLQIQVGDTAAVNETLEKIKAKLESADSKDNSAHSLADRFSGYIQALAKDPGDSKTEELLTQIYCLLERQLPKGLAKGQITFLTKTTGPKYFSNILNAIIETRKAKLGSRRDDEALQSLLDIAEIKNDERAQFEILEEMFNARKSTTPEENFARAASGLKLAKLFLVSGNEAKANDLFKTSLDQISKDQEIEERDSVSNQIEKFFEYYFAKGDFDRAEVAVRKLIDIRAARSKGSYHFRTIDYSPREKLLEHFERTGEYDKQLDLQRYVVASREHDKGASPEDYGEDIIDLANMMILPAVEIKKNKRKLLHESNQKFEEGLTEVMKTGRGQTKYRNYLKTRANYLAQAGLDKESAQMSKRAAAH